VKPDARRFPFAFDCEDLSFHLQLNVFFRDAGNEAMSIRVPSFSIISTDVPMIHRDGPLLSAQPVVEKVLNSLNGDAG